MALSGQGTACLDPACDPVSNRSDLNEIRFAANVTLVAPKTSHESLIRVTIQDVLRIPAKKKPEKAGICCLKFTRPVLFIPCGIVTNHL